MSLSRVDRALYRALLPLCAKLDANSSLQVFLSEILAPRKAVAAKTPFSGASPRLGHKFAATIVNSLLQRESAQSVVSTNQKLGPRWHFPRRGIKETVSTLPGQESAEVANGSNYDIEGLKANLNHDTFVETLRALFRVDYSDPSVLYSRSDAQNAGLLLLRYLNERLHWAKEDYVQVDFPSRLFPLNKQKTFLPSPPSPLPCFVGHTNALAPGTLLISHPFLNGSFQRCVVLILEAGPTSGTLGVLIQPSSTGVPSMTPPANFRLPQLPATEIRIDGQTLRLNTPSLQDISDHAELKSAHHSDSCISKRKLSPPILCYTRESRLSIHRVETPSSMAANPTRRPRSVASKYNGVHTAPKNSATASAPLPASLPASVPLPASKRHTIIESVRQFRTPGARLALERLHERGVPVVGEPNSALVLVDNGKTRVFRALPFGPSLDAPTTPQIRELQDRWTLASWLQTHGRTLPGVMILRDTNSDGPNQPITARILRRRRLPSESRPAAEFPFRSTRSHLRRFRAGSRRPIALQPRSFFSSERPAHPLPYASTYSNAASIRPSASTTSAAVPQEATSFPMTPANTRFSRNQPFAAHQYELWASKENFGFGPGTYAAPVTLGWEKDFLCLVFQGSKFKFHLNRDPSRAKELDPSLRSRDWLASQISDIELLRDTEHGDQGPYAFPQPAASPLRPLSGPLGNDGQDVDEFDEFANDSTTINAEDRDEDDDEEEDEVDEEGGDDDSDEEDSDDVDMDVDDIESFLEDVDDALSEVELRNAAQYIPLQLETLFRNPRGTPMIGRRHARTPRSLHLPSSSLDPRKTHRPFFASSSPSSSSFSPSVTSPSKGKEDPLLDSSDPPRLPPYTLDFRTEQGRRPSSPRSRLAAAPYITFSVTEHLQISFPLRREGGRIFVSGTAAQAPLPHLRKKAQAVLQLWDQYSAAKLRDSPYAQKGLPLPLSSSSASKAPVLPPISELPPLSPTLLVSPIGYFARQVKAVQPYILRSGGPVPGYALRLSRPTEPAANAAVGDTVAAPTTASAVPDPLQINWEQANATVFPPAFHIAPTPPPHRAASTNTATTNHITQTASSSASATRSPDITSITSTIAPVTPPAFHVSGEVGAPADVYISGATVWSPGQLEQELAEGAWLQLACSDPLALFHHPTLSLWSDILTALQGQAAALPGLPKGDFIRASATLVPGVGGEPLLS